MKKFAVSLDYPHRWTSGPSLYNFETLDEAKAFAEEHAGGKWGGEGYCQVRIYALVEGLN